MYSQRRGECLGISLPRVKQNRDNARCVVPVVFGARLEDDATSDLDDALSATASGDLPVGSAGERCRRGAKVYEVEHVRYLAAKLEARLFEDVEVAEEGSIDVTVSRIRQLSRADISE